MVIIEVHDELYWIQVARRGGGGIEEDILEAVVKGAYPKRGSRFT